MSKLYYGCALYPEIFGVPGEREIGYLQRLNMNFVRMGEFAWSALEPEPGEYHLELLERSIDILGKAGIGTVLCTPGAAPPVWLTHGHPDRCVRKRNGERYTAGGRQHVCYNNPVFREKVGAVTEALVRRFGRDPHVIGWQIDNELRSAVPECCCQECEERWHKWLADRFSTVGALNEAWHTAVWSLHFRNFDEVPVPGVTTFTTAETPFTGMIPQLELAYREFGQETAVDYLQMQCGIIRSGSDAPITHNDGATHHLNRAASFSALDFASTDCYTAPAGCETFFAVCELYRGLKPDVPFRIMETSPAHGGSMVYCQPVLPEKYVMNEVVAAFFAGADGFAFWHFRQSPGGSEMPHSALLTNWGAPGLGFAEAEQAGKWIRENEALLTKSRLVPAQAALVCSDSGKNRLQSEPIGEFDRNFHFRTTVSYASILRECAGCIDILPDQAPARKETRLLWSWGMPYLAPEELQRGLSVAEKGGVWIVGPLTGYRDRYGCAHTANCLEPELERICGLKPAWCYSATGCGETGSGFGCSTGLRGWSCFFDTEDDKAAGIMTSGRSTGKAFAVESAYGKGKILVLGSQTDEIFLKAMLRHYCRELSMPDIQVPPGSYLIRREGPDGEFAAALNLDGKGGVIRYIGQEIRLAPFEVRNLGCGGV